MKKARGLVIVPPAHAEPVSYAVAVIVKELREQRGWSPARLAQRAGVTRQCVDLTEKHNTAPRLNTTACLATAFGLRTSALISTAEARLRRRRNRARRSCGG